MTKIENNYGFVTYVKDVDFCDSEDGEDYVRIDSLYVYEDYRRQGNARKLLNSAVSEIKGNYPGLQIKIIANPEENSIDTLDLYNFYDSINGIDEVVV